MRRPILQVKSRGLIALGIILCSVPACSAGTKRSQSQRYLSPTGLKEHQDTWEYALKVTEETAANFSQSYPGIEPHSWVQQEFLTEWKMRLLLEKALRGEEIRIGAVGGSITQGAGDVGTNYTYVAHLGRSLQEAFPSANVTVNIGARGGTGSATTGFCLNELVGDNIDLLVVDFTLNDYQHYTNNTTPVEHLVRQAIMGYPNAAVIMVGFWGMGFNTEYNDNYIGHKWISHHYEVAWVKARRLARYMINNGIRSQSEILYDQHHPWMGFHTLLGDMLTFTVMSAGMTLPELAKKKLLKADMSLRQTRDRQLSAPTRTLSPFPPGWKMPLPINKQLHGVNNRLPGDCDIVGLPKMHGTHELRSVVKKKGWRYHLVGKASLGRTDRKHDLMPSTLFPENNTQYILLDVDVQDTFLLAECARIAEYSVEKQGCPHYIDYILHMDESQVPFHGNEAERTRHQGTPFRVFLHEMDVEVPIRPWVSHITEMWVPDVPVPKGRYKIRLEPQELWCPYSCLGAVISM